MRKNQIILDEAARSVRRTFVSSLAGSATMLGVIGAAGAYGMPERLSAHSLSTALTTLQMKLTPMVDAAQPAVERAAVVADNFKRRVRPVVIESDDEVILQVPRVMLASAGPVRTFEPSRVQELSAPVSQPVAPPTDVIAMPEEAEAAPVAEKPAAVAIDKPAAKPVVAEKPAPVPAAKSAMVALEKPAPVPAAKPEPAPTVTAALVAPVKSEPVMPVPPAPPRTMPGAMPDVIGGPAALPALLVFEQPDLDKIKPLTEFPKLELVEQPKAVEAPSKPESTKSESSKSESAKPEPKKPEPQKTASEKTAPVAAKLEQPKSEELKIVASLAMDVPKAVETPAAKAADNPADKPAEKPADNPAGNPAMSAMASASADTSDTEEYPKTVMIHLPVPKPPLTPAQLLDLRDADYDKSEKCLAQAVYFEARDEPVRGQQAVAQVVLNRVFSPYYPKDVCSVVYQNAHRHLSCQFTFACDGKPEAIRERGAWARANRIAKQALDAKVWLPEVAKATHYHATYVHPDWISDMKMLVKTGAHIFYRPRNWGDGANEPGWGTPKAAAVAAPLPASSAHKKKS